MWATGRRRCACRCPVPPWSRATPRCGTGRCRCRRTTSRCSPRGDDPAVPTLLVVHHTPSPVMQALLEAVREGAALVEEVELVVRPALSAGAADLLAADGVLLGTPANIGYMSGALKHFFDTVY